jgi:hypothetical protein
LLYNILKVHKEQKKHEIQTGTTTWKHHIRLYERGLFIVVTAAALLRITLISNNWPILSGDEAMTGLIAKQLVTQGVYPLFSHGLHYISQDARSLDVYTGAVFFFIFGPSVFALRAGLIFFSAFFLLTMFYLTRLLYNKRLALITTGLLAIGSSDLFLHQLEAVGNYVETACLGALLFLIASWLAITAQGGLQGRAPSAQRKRLLLYTLSGLLAGLALWSNQMMLCWIGTTMLLLFLSCRHELCRWYGLYLLLGAILGAFPLIVYYVQALFAQGAPGMLLSQYHAAGAAMSAQPASLPRQLVGTLLYALPTITGAGWRCPVNALPLFGPASAQTLACTLKQGGWTAGYCALGGYACYLAVRALKQCQQHNAHSTSDHEERLYVTLQRARLLLLTSAFLTLIVYALVPQSALAPDTTSGDLIGLLIALPAFFWPLCNGVVQYKARTIYFVWLMRVVSVALLLLVEVTFAFGTAQTLREIPRAQAAYRSDMALVSDLLTIRATHVYADYDTCGKLMLQSDGLIICSSLDEYLQPVPDQYQSYQPGVAEAPIVTYVYRSGAPQIATIEHEIRILSVPYQRYTFEGYIVYRTPVPLQ